MIISFNPIIFQNQDNEIQATLAEILIALMKANQHFIDIKSINAIFYNENGEYIFDFNVIATRYLSSDKRRYLKEFLNKISQKPITILHRQHLSCIVIGIDDNKEIHPNNAYKIITERSKVIVENGINDWKFIIGIDNIGIGESKIKDKFPEMFLDKFSYREFEERCKHHQVFLVEANEFVSEIEQILLKITKII